MNTFESNRRLHGPAITFGTHDHSAIDIVLNSKQTKVFTHCSFTAEYTRSSDLCSLWILGACDYQCMTHVRKDKRRWSSWLAQTSHKRLSKHCCDHVLVRHAIRPLEGLYIPAKVCIPAIFCEFLPQRNKNKTKMYSLECWGRFYVTRSTWQSVRADQYCLAICVWRVGLSRLCSSTFEQLLAFGATFCSSSNLEQVLPFWATFESKIQVYSTYQARKSEQFVRKLQFMQIYWIFINVEFPVEYFQ